LSLAGCEEAGDELGSDDFRAEEKDARCDYFVRCGIMPDRAACDAAVAQDPGTIQALGAVPFGRVDYDAIAAQEYLDLLSEASCDGTLALARELEDARKAVFSGNVSMGNPCWTDEECAGGDAVCDTLACDGAGQLCCHGTCKPFRVLAIGDNCPLNSDETDFRGCSDDAYCAPPADDGSGEPPMLGICTPRADNGMPCEAVDGCQDGLRCNVGDSGTCYQLSGSGGECNPNLGNGSCIRIDEVCGPGMRRCVDAPGPGQPCIQGRCQLHAICQDDTCRARPRAGQPCDGSIPCLGDLNCQDGTCQRSGVSLVCVSGEPPPPMMGG
jgi:hypothetical protein